METLRIDDDNGGRMQNLYISGKSFNKCRSLKIASAAQDKVFTLNALRQVPCNDRLSKTHSMRLSIPYTRVPLFLELEGL